MTIRVIVALVLCLADTDAIISKCIRKGEDEVTFNCPAGHVIYQPIIFVGTSSGNTCTYQDGDCIGLTYNLLTQTNKCFWQNKCTVRWRDQLPIVSSNNTNCKGILPNYVNMENPLCVPKDAVIDICSKDVEISNMDHGVIRSHDAYPWAYVSLSERCRVILPAKRGRTLVVSVDAVDLVEEDVLSIRKTSKETNIVLFKGHKFKTQTHEATDLEQIEITFNLNDAETVGTGFLIRFEYRSADSSNGGDLTMRSFGTLNLFKHTLFNAYGAIEECITPKREQINITCPSGHVIYKPEVKVGVSTDGKCSYRLGDCLGMTHTFLTQKNVCYWKGSCEFSWRTGIPITMSQTLRCLSLPPKYISLSGYSCIEEDKVVDLCDKGFVVINKTSAVIKSHSQYPWHYKAVKLSCRKRIRVPKNGILRMRTQDIDLDPDTKGDNIKIYHIKNGRSLRTKVRGNKEINETFNGGCVELHFRVSPRSKAGRGFVITFETNSGDSLSETDFDSCGKTSKKSKSKKGNKRRKKHNKGKKKRTESQRKRNKKSKKKGKSRRNKSRKHRQQ